VTVIKAVPTVTNLCLVSENDCWIWFSLIQLTPVKQYFIIHETPLTERNPPK